MNNFDVVVSEAPPGYKRIPGYERRVGNPVPGVGPILECTVVGGCVFASRSDGVKVQCYILIDETWEKYDGACAR